MLIGAYGNEAPVLPQRGGEGAAVLSFLAVASVGKDRSRWRKTVLGYESGEAERFVSQSTEKKFLTESFFKEIPEKRENFVLSSVELRGMLKFS